MSEEKKQITAGKWIGFVSFFHIATNLIFDKVIILIRPEIDLGNLYKISVLSYLVFVIVWGAVFGSSAIKKLKNNGDNNG